MLNEIQIQKICRKKSRVRKKGSEERHEDVKTDEPFVDGCFCNYWIICMDNLKNGER